VTRPSAFHGRPVRPLWQLSAGGPGSAAPLPMAPAPPLPAKLPTPEERDPRRRPRSRSRRGGDRRSVSSPGKESGTRASDHTPSAEPATPVPGMRPRPPIGPAAIELAKSAKFAQACADAPWPPQNIAPVHDVGLPRPSRRSVVDAFGGNRGGANRPSWSSRAPHCLRGVDGDRGWRAMD
jgi:hypothetical protein